MRKSILLLFVSLSLPLGGCAYGLGGQDVLGSVLGDVLGGNRGAMGGQTFEDAAVEACANEARRYGSVSVTDVRAQSSSTMRVNGVVAVNGYSRRAFGCSFREDGRITDFDIQ
jgi:hypothetical protein